MTTALRTALITGASAGIGRAAARRFHERGWRVVLVARSADRLAELAGSLTAGPEAVAVPADVTDPASMAALSERVLQDIGCPEVVVANAGIGLDALFVETTDEDLRRIFEVNVFGLVRTVRPFVRPMAARGSGRILLISSVIGKRGIPNYSAYAASKFAVHGLADSLRAELSGTGVTVGVICPSSTESEFRDRMERRGPPQNDSRIARHSADSVARAIVAMANSRKREKVLSIEGKLLALLDAIAPGLLDRILARFVMTGKMR